MNKYLHLLTITFLLLTNISIQAQNNNKRIVFDKQKKVKAELNYKNCKVDDAFSRENNIACSNAEINIFKNNKKLQKIEIELDIMHPISKDDLKFIDFNFDGIEDLIIRNENLSGYGNSAYNIYLYSKTNNKYELNEEFTRLTNEIESDGKIEIDNKKKLIYRNCHIGGPTDWLEIYQIINNKPIMIKSVKWEQVLNRKNDSDFEVEIKELKNKKWTRVIKNVKENEIKNYIKR